MYCTSLHVNGWSKFNGHIWTSIYPQITTISQMTFTLQVGDISQERRRGKRKREIQDRERQREEERGRKGKEKDDCFLLFCLDFTKWSFAVACGDPDINYINVIWRMERVAWLIDGSPQLSSHSTTPLSNSSLFLHFAANLAINIITSNDKFALPHLA